MQCTSKHWGKKRTMSDKTTTEGGRRDEWSCFHVHGNSERIQTLFPGAAFECKYPNLCVMSKWVHVWTEQMIIHRISTKRVDDISISDWLWNQGYKPLTVRTMGYLHQIGDKSVKAVRRWDPKASVGQSCQNPFKVWYKQNTVTPAVQSVCVISFLLHALLMQPPPTNGPNSSCVLHVWKWTPDNVQTCSCEKTSLREEENLRMCLTWHRRSVRSARGQRSAASNPPCPPPWTWRSTAPSLPMTGQERNNSEPIGAEYVYDCRRRLWGWRHLKRVRLLKAGTTTRSTYCCY